MIVRRARPASRAELFLLTHGTNEANLVRPREAKPMWCDPADRSQRAAILRTEANALRSCGPKPTWCDRADRSL